MQILYGMAQAVVPLVAAVASTTHPGSVNNQPLRRGHAQMNNCEYVYDIIT